MCFRRRRLSLNFGHWNTERMTTVWRPTAQLRNAQTIILKRNNTNTVKSYARHPNCERRFVKAFGRCVRLQARFSMVTVPGCLARAAKTMRADAAHGSVCTIQKKILQNNERQIDVIIGFASYPCASRLMFGVESWSCVDVASASIFNTHKNDVAELGTSTLHPEAERENSDDINNDCNMEHKRTFEATVLHDVQQCHSFDWFRLLRLSCGCRLTKNGPRSLLA